MKKQIFETEGRSSKYKPLFLRKQLGACGFRSLDSGLPHVLLTSKDNSGAQSPPQDGHWTSALQQAPHFTTKSQARLSHPGGGRSERGEEGLAPLITSPGVLG